MEASPQVCYYIASGIIMAQRWSTKMNECSLDRPARNSAVVKEKRKTKNQTGGQQQGVDTPELQRLLECSLDHPARNSARVKKKRQTKNQMGGQHYGVDTPELQRLLECRRERRELERYCHIVKIPYKL
ncbi:hypothetical protein PoB_006084700 [Plakobranchus ocellatus]|uniref:Uncharacterized protein n=1 Tax=Plakobranchus ocellatus TaxID=259542 RepID=A0AAV4CR35_9GAST|nr:hypothetical protein PoB_006084700 [Plakobranchus ocellatus]